MTDTEHAFSANRALPPVGDWVGGCVSLGGDVLSVCVCVCVCEREREREREIDQQEGKGLVFLSQGQTA